MLVIEDKFIIENSSSKGFSTHLEGDVPFISNGTYNNGFVGYVSPIQGEKVFERDGITVSAFGDAIVQRAPFLPRGNGGSGLTVLLPKNEMSIDQLYSYASQVNAQKWRFSYSRMVTKDRIRDLPIIDVEVNVSVDKTINHLFPLKKNKKLPKSYKFLWFKVIDLCKIEKKSAPPQNQMSAGETPYVTTSSKNNGVTDYVDEIPNSRANMLTVSLNGSVAEAFFQFDDFVTSGDNAILSLKQGQDSYLLLYIAFLIRRQRWRYNYYRKLTISKLKKTMLPMPVTTGGEIDKTYIKDVLEETFGFDIVKKFL